MWTFNDLQAIAFLTRTIKWRLEIDVIVSTTILWHFYTDTIISISEFYNP